MYKPKILVVEDDPAITNLIRTTLDTQEYQYHTAKNGAGATVRSAAFLGFKPVRPRRGRSAPARA